VQLLIQKKENPLQIENAGLNNSRSPQPSQIIHFSDLNNLNCKLPNNAVSHRNNGNLYAHNFGHSP
jgi:hypothetical protein